MSQEQDFILELQQVQPVFLLDRKPKVAESYYVHMHTIALRARPLRSFLGDPYKIPLTKAALCASREPPSSDVKKEKKKKKPTKPFSHTYTFVYLLSYCQSVEDTSTAKQHTLNIWDTENAAWEALSVPALYSANAKNVPFVMVVNEFSCSPFSLDLC